jgi:hypothetical protein
MLKRTGTIARRAFALCLVAFPPTFAFGHSEPPTHTCMQPTRPPDKNDAEVWNRFIDQVDTYRSCMSQFIAENQQAAELHRAAANAATEEWNTFVHSSLNVPEDFPWPKPDKPEPRETPKE